MTSNCITKRRRPSNSKIYLFVSVKRRCHSQGAKKGFVKEVLRLLRINSSHSTFNNFTLTTTRLNLLLLKTLNYSKTIQRLALSFRNPHLFHSNVTKTKATFWSEVHFKPMTNLELSNALAHDAKLVLSFIM